MHVFYSSVHICIYMQAIRSRAYYEYHVWFLYGWYSDKWWNTTDPVVNCTEDELIAVLQNAIIFQQLPINKNVKLINDLIVNKPYDKYKYN